MSEKHALRQQLRRQRKALSPRERHRANQQLTRALSRLLKYRAHRAYASYHAYGSEISPRAYEGRSRHAYHPRLRGLEMSFYPRHGPQRRSALGIQEPLATRRKRPLWAMSYILIPLIGFDAQGRRLGQGGGYYDRALAKLRFRQPLLIGLAYDCQQSSRIPTQVWDKTLDMVVTPSRTLTFNRI